jgi:DNA (cytosine-5)-methyltransferase 1
MTWTVLDEFSGAGGGSQGIEGVEGAEVVVAANHDKMSIASHQANFPTVKHIRDDIRHIDYREFPACDLAHFSPICPPFSDARGKKQYFDADSQTVLWETADMAQLKAETRRGRVLMYEVHRYLEAMMLRGRPVLAGTVENVVQAVKWDHFQTWLNRFHVNGYETRVLAVNSAHLHPVKTLRPPQRRGRLLVLFWLRDIGRAPDTDKWLTRPWAWCPSCDEWVRAVQVFKKPGAFMGLYGIRHGQYFYRCPHRSCGGRIVEPHERPAIDAIDWTLPAQKIGERVDAKGRPDPLEEATIRRITAGIAKHYAAMLTPAGGTWRDSVVPLSVPMPARSTRDSDMVAYTGEWDRRFAFLMRNNGSRADGAEHCTPVTEAMRTLTTKGHQSLVLWNLLVPYYTHGSAYPAGDRPMGTLSTRDRYLFASGGTPPADVNEAFARMIAPHEAGFGMGFYPDYIVLGTHKDKMRQYGQAITPVLTELAYSAIIEMLSGQGFDPAPWNEPSPPARDADVVPWPKAEDDGQGTLFDSAAA